MSTGSSSSTSSSRAQSTVGSAAQTAGVFLSAAAPKPKTSASDPSPDGDDSESGGGGAGRDWNTRADWLEVFVIGFITVVWGVMFIGNGAGFLQPGPAYDQLRVLVVALVSQYIGMSRNEREQEKIR